MYTKKRINHCLPTIQIKLSVLYYYVLDQATFPEEVIVMLKIVIGVITCGKTPLPRSVKRRATWDSVSYLGSILCNCKA